MKITKTQACMAAAAVFNPGVALVAMAAYYHAQDKKEDLAKEAKALVKEHKGEITNALNKLQKWLED